MNNVNLSPIICSDCKKEFSSVLKFKQHAEMSHFNTMSWRQTSVDSLVLVSKVFFIENEELSQSTAVQVFNLFEKSWWYYEDNFVDNNNIKAFHYRDLKSFSWDFIQIIPQFQNMNRENFEEFFEVYQKDKCQRPVAGCIILNETMDKIVLVKSWKYKIWTLPRGKQEVVTY
jgi:mRNA-decapping enzyme subunit 2